MRTPNKSCERNGSSARKFRCLSRIREFNLHPGTAMAREDLTLCSSDFGWLLAALSAPTALATCPIAACLGATLQPTPSAHARTRTVGSEKNWRAVLILAVY